MPAEETREQTADPGDLRLLSHPGLEGLTGCRAPAGSPEHTLRGASKGKYQHTRGVLETRKGENWRVTENS